MIPIPFSGRRRPRTGSVAPYPAMHPPGLAAQRIRRAASVVLLAAASCGPPVTAGVVEQAVTAGATTAAARAVLDRLQEVGTGLMGNGSVAVGGAVTQFSGLIDEFEDLTRDQVATPLDDLGMSARVVAQQLRDATFAYGALLDHHRDCIFQNLELFVAGLNTVTADLKRGVPYTDLDQPRLTSFRFDGSRTPNVVPREAGRLTLAGHRLWRGEAPRVAVLDGRRRTVLVRPRPERGGSAHEVSLVVERALLAAHAGECLQLHLQTRERRRGHSPWSGGGVASTGDLFLPMCIPETYRMRLKLSASVHHTLAAVRERRLSPRRFGLSNRSCERAARFSETKGWNSEIPAGWRIVRVEQSGPDIENQTNVGVSFDARSVTAAGWLDRATCVEGPFFDAVVHDTHWYMDLAPVIAGPASAEQTWSAALEPMPVQRPTTRLCARIPADTAAIGASTSWLTLAPYLRGEAGVAPFYESPRLTAHEDRVTHADEARGYRIEASFDPTAADGIREVCAMVTVPQQCGF